VHLVAIVYRVDAEPGELVDEVDGSTERCAWIPLRDVASLPLIDVAAYAVELVGPS